jgi:hypothetical protein
MAPKSRPRSGLKFPIYSDEVLDRIIEAAGGLPEDDREVDVLTGIKPTGQKSYERAIGREALRLCFEGAAEHYTRSYRSSGAPTQAMLAKRYSSAEGAALKLLAALKGKPGKASKADRVAPILQTELGLELAGGVPTLEALSGSRAQELIRLLDDCAPCLTRLRKKSVIKPSKRTSADVALDELIRWLGHAYLLVFQEAPGASVDDGTVYGPFIGFVRAALEPLLEEVPTSGAIRARMRRVLPSFRPLGNGQVE